MLTRSTGFCAAWLLLAVSIGREQEPVSAQAAATLPAIPVLEGGLLDAWAEHIRPSADELAWEAIEWHSTFARGVLAADAEERPLVFWAMNGHPLGCT